jgi:hypothetical protein
VGRSINNREVITLTLIACPECQHQVSTQAAACPSCGCPINQDSDHHQVPATPRPNLAEDLSIGRQVSNWSGETVIDGYCGSAENNAAGIPDGKVHILIHKHGVELTRFDEIESERTNTSKMAAMA